MSNDSDWKAIYPEAIARGRTRVEPPTIEDVEALYRDQLSDAEAERVREQLAYYPELADAMTDQQFDADLAAIARENEPAAASAVAAVTPRWFSPPVLALAASLVVVLAIGGVYLGTRNGLDSRQVVTRVLDADGLKGGTRGSGQTPIQLSTATDYLLKPVLRPQRPYGEYRLELVDIDSSPPQSIWTRNDVQREPDGSFPVNVSTSDLQPGVYQLVLYGIDGERAEQLATYTIRFSAP